MHLPGLEGALMVFPSADAMTYHLQALHLSSWGRRGVATICPGPVPLLEGVAPSPQGFIQLLELAVLPSPAPSLISHIDTLVEHTSTKI